MASDSYDSHMSIRNGQIIFSAAFFIRFSLARTTMGTKAEGCTVMQFKVKQVLCDVH